MSDRPPRNQFCRWALNAGATPASPLKRSPDGAAAQEGLLAVVVGGSPARGIPRISVLLTRRVSFGSSGGLDAAPWHRYSMGECRNG